MLLLWALLLLPAQVLLLRGLPAGFAEVDIAAIASGTAAVVGPVSAAELACRLMLLLAEFCSKMFLLLPALLLRLTLLLFLTLFVLSDISVDAAAAFSRQLMLLLPLAVLCHRCAAAVGGAACIIDAANDKSESWYLRRRLLCSCWPPVDTVAA